MNIKRASGHLKKYLLVYTFVAMGIGFLFGISAKDFILTHKSLMKNLIITFAILTIYPSMIQLHLEELKNVAKKPREITLAMLIIFLVAPFIAIGFGHMIPDKQVALGYIAANVVPASSASIGYVLIAEGSVELATLLALLSLVGAFIAVPAYIGFYASVTSVSVSMGSVVASLSTR